MDTDIQSRPNSRGQSAGGGKRPNANKGLVICVLIVVAVVALLGWSWWLFGRSTAYNENKKVNTAEYQAVFLTNGQVYFGKLSDLNNKYVTISDIYYLQVQQADTTDSSKLQNASGNTDTGAQVSLAKLGTELHGPEDKMHISSDQVLFWENLKNTSKVTEAINKYKNK